MVRRLAVSPVSRAILTHIAVPRYHQNGLFLHSN